MSPSDQSQMFSCTAVQDMFHPHVRFSIGKTKRLLKTKALLAKRRGDFSSA